MAALNFPDPNVQTSYTNPNTGITYEWSNGIWKAVRTAQTAPELFVDVDGDNLTGNLTLGTDKIVLNATDGSAEFAGDVDINGGFTTTDGVTLEGAGQVRIRGDNLPDASAGLAIFRNGSTGTSIVSRINYDGSAKFDGNVAVGEPNGNAQNVAGVFTNKDGRLEIQQAANSTNKAFRVLEGSAERILFNCDGSAEFAGSVEVGGDPFQGVAIGVKAYQDGSFATNQTIGTNKSIMVFNGGTDPTAYIRADGSATFAGAITRDATGDSHSFLVNRDGTQRMRIDPFGGIFIGDTSGDLNNTNSTIALVADGSATFAGAVDTQSIKATSSTNAYFISNGDGLYYYNASGSNTGYILADGSATFAGYGQFGSSTYTYRGILALNNDTGGTIYARNHKSGGAVYEGANASDVTTSRIYENGSAYFASNLGIGTASPDQQLTIKRSGGQTQVSLISDTTQSGAIYFGDTASTSRGVVRYDHNGDYMRLYTAGTEQMRITSDGKMRIGMANYAAAPSESNGGTQIKNENTGHFITAATVTTGTNHHLFFNPNGLVGSIKTTGSATSFNESSDYRLKENVVDITDGITRIKQLQPRRFNFIADADTTVDGFLAHEAQVVVPEAVTGTHNEVDDDGNAVMQGIDKSKLVPLLTAALQEAIAKIETLETEVAALKAS